MAIARKESVPIPGLPFAPKQRYSGVPDVGDSSPQVQSHCDVEMDLV